MLALLDDDVGSIYSKPSGEKPCTSDTIWPSASKLFCTWPCCVLNGGSDNADEVSWGWFILCHVDFLFDKNWISRAYLLVVNMLSFTTFAFHNLKAVKSSTRFEMRLDFWRPRYLFYLQCFEQQRLTNLYLDLHCHGLALPAVIFSNVLGAYYRQSCWGLVVFLRCKKCEACKLHHEILSGIQIAQLPFRCWFLLWFMAQPEVVSSKLSRRAKMQGYFSLVISNLLSIPSEEYELYQVHSKGWQTESVRYRLFPRIVKIK